MPSGKYRSRSFTRKRINLPGGKNVIHYARRKPGFAHCSECGAVLGGIPHLRNTKKRNLPKTQKRPERPYAGNLCPECLKLKARSVIFGTILH
ncbi:MAG TPA: 50S ribosomal protein L34e [Candidatus Lokiarchaeia archaeon]|nr:50S ribosomal protein L34e [Candidatus Lokiarchaeia archaeon]